ncbi:MAG: hypothetical protein ACT4OS_12330 [Acidimicrobiales bacterium]
MNTQLSNLAPTQPARKHRRLRAAIGGVVAAAALATATPAQALTIDVGATTVVEARAAIRRAVSVEVGSSTAATVDTRIARPLLRAVLRAVATGRATVREVIRDARTGNVVVVDCLVTALPLDIDCVVAVN